MLKNSNKVEYQRAKNIVVAVNGAYWTDLAQKALFK